MKTPQVTPEWETGIYIGNGTIAQEKSKTEYDCGNCNNHWQHSKTQEQCPKCKSWHVMTTDNWSTYDAKNELK